ncbi:hypothetical protein BH09SUM1_BH09SUM1_01490 [soil metagenome]
MTRGGLSLCLIKSDLRKILRQGIFLWLAIPWLCLAAFAFSIEASLLFPPQWMLTNVGVLVFHSLPAMLTPDVFCAFILYLILTQGRHWRQLRHDLGLTTTRGRDIVKGVATVPFLLLAFYDLVSFPYSYSARDLGYFWKHASQGSDWSGFQQYAYMGLTITLMIGAKVAFTAVAVLAVQQGMLKSNPSRRFKRVRVFIFATGVGLAAIILGEIASAAGPHLFSYTTSHWLRDMAMAFVAHGMPVLAIAILAVFLYRQAVRNADGWLILDDSPPPT